MKNLTLKKLNEIFVDEVRKIESLNEFRSEIKRVLGSSVVLHENLDDLAYEANDRLSVLERTGRLQETIDRFDNRVIRRFSRHPSQEVRKFVASVTDEGTLSKMVVNEDSSTVLREIFKRLPLSEVRKYRRYFRDDDLVLYEINRRLSTKGTLKALHEAADDDSLGLSDLWYEQKAQRIISDYGSDIDFSRWRQVVRNLKSSERSVMGVDFSEDKLLKKIHSLLKDMNT